MGGPYKLFTTRTCLGVFSNISHVLTLCCHCFISQYSTISNIGYLQICLLRPRQSGHTCRKGFKIESILALSPKRSRGRLSMKDSYHSQIAKTTWFVRVRSILRLPKPVWLSLMKFVAAIPLQPNILSEDPQYRFLPNAVAYQNQAICSFKLYLESGTAWRSCKR